MRLTTHNILCCNTKLCRDNEQPLGLVIERSQVREKEFDAEHVKRVVNRMHWATLSATAVQVT